MADTAATIIKGALRALGAIETGETPSTEMYADGLEALNQLLSNLSEDSILIPSRTTEQLTISAVQPSYTIGTGGDFDTDWPQEIEHAYFRDNGVDTPAMVVGARQYLDIYDKYTSGSPPTAVYYEPSYPLGVLHFNIQPLTTHTLYLTSLKPLSEFALITTEIVLQSSYKRFMKWNLAVELAPEYGQGDVGLVMKNADDSRDAIERRIFASRSNNLKIDNALLHRGADFDINVGP